MNKICTSLTKISNANIRLQGAAKLTKDDIEKVFSLYDRVSIPL